MKPFSFFCVLSFLFCGFGCIFGNLESEKEESVSEADESSSTEEIDMNDEKRKCGVHVSWKSFGKSFHIGYYTCCNSNNNSDE